MKNEKIRRALNKHGLCQWELAKMLNIAESTMSRHLREELPEEETERILKIIEKGGTDDE